VLIGYVIGARDRAGRLFTTLTLSVGLLLAAGNAYGLALFITRSGTASYSVPTPVIPVGLTLLLATGLTLVVASFRNMKT